MAKRKATAKSPILYAEPYRNENASISFNGGVVSAIRTIRQDVVIMAGRTEVNEYAPGAIHLLRKLCDGEPKSGHIYVAEVLEWQAAVFEWLARVEKLIPPQLRDTYRTNLEDDIRVILASADGNPAVFSRREANERWLPVPFDSDAALDQAREAADRKHPVRLGSALHEYLKECVRKLVEDS